MVALCIACLLQLTLPASALRSVTKKTSGVPEILKSFRAARVEEIKNDPRRLQWLGNPFREKQPRGNATTGMGCSINEMESCPLNEMNWTTKVFPGGMTKCMNGDAYYFEVAPGAADKLLIHFEGGGFCSVPEAMEMGLCRQEIYTGLDNNLIGFRNSCPQIREEVRNTFNGYTAIHIRYCSGDLHLLDRLTDWETTNRAGKQVKVEQRGYRNALAAFEWVKANIHGKLASLVVSGTSAGAIATGFWAALMLTEMSYKHATVIADSWIGLDGSIMQKLGACDSPILASTKSLHMEPLLCKAKPSLVELRDKLIAAFPTVAFAQLLSKFDAVQMFAYDALPQAQQLAELRAYCKQEDPCDISLAPSELMVRTVGISPEKFYSGVNEILKIHSRHPNFSSYLLAGEYHEIAEFIFGNCPSLDYSLMPDFTINRKVRTQRWISSSLISTPKAVCEDLPYKSWDGTCDQSLGSIRVRG